MSKIFSVGYAAHTQESLIALLVDAGVRVVADVRANPVSRKKGFSKRQLEAALKVISQDGKVISQDGETKVISQDGKREAGIEYRSVRALGIPTSDRAAASGAGGWTKLLSDYAASLDVPEAAGGRAEAAAQLAEDAKLKPTAVMCLETDLNHCHRKPLSEWIAKKNGMELRHLG